jgi:hypothetical protein
MTTGVFNANLMPVMTVIPDATKRRLEPQYTSSQSISRSQSPGQHTGNQQPSSSNTPASATSSSIRDGRLLPSRDVTDQNFDNAYVDFIMYCNPSIPLDVDTTELRKIFRAPPKSDGNNFSTFTLFQLIRKLETKEIKTVQNPFFYSHS